MIIIKVKEAKNLDKSLKAFKRKFELTGVLRELRKRQEFRKPSEKKRDVRLKAIYRQKMRDQQADK